MLSLAEKYWQWRAGVEDTFNKKREEKEREREHLSRNTENGLNRQRTVVRRHSTSLINA